MSYGRLNGLLYAPHPTLRNNREKKNVIFQSRFMEYG